MRAEAWRRNLSAYPFQEAAPTRFMDLDGMNHVNHAAMAGLYQEPRISFLRELWAGIEGPRPRQLVAAIAIAYLREVSHPTRLQIGLGVLEVRNTSYVIGQAAFDGAICIGVMDCTFVCSTEGAHGLPSEVLPQMKKLALRGKAGVGRA